MRGTHAIQPVRVGPATPRRRRRGVLIGALVLALALGGLGYAWWSGVFLRRPAEALSSSTAAYAELNLRPDLAELVNAALLAPRLDYEARDAASLNVRDNDPKATLALAFFTETLGVTGVDYGRDLAPWLGDRIGIGWSPAGTVYALAATDSARAQTTLQALLTPAHGYSGEAHVTTAGGFALVSTSDGLLSESAAAAASGATLARAATFAKDAGALDRGAPFVAWVDAQRALGAPGSALLGRARAARVFGALHVRPDCFEVDARVVDLPANAGLSGSAAGLVDAAPADAAWVVATSAPAQLADFLGVTFKDAQLTALLSSALGPVASGDQLRRGGVTEITALGLPAGSSVAPAVRVRAADPDAYLAGGGGGLVRRDGDVVTVAPDQAALERAAVPSAVLGLDPAYAALVRDLPGSPQARFMVRPAALPGATPCRFGRHLVGRRWGRRESRRHRPGPGAPGPLTDSPSASGW